MDSDYWVAPMSGNSDVKIVHFNCLKLCKAGTRFTHQPSVDNEHTTPLICPTSNTTAAHGTVGDNLQLVDGDDDDGESIAQHRLHRARHLPGCYDDYFCLPLMSSTGCTLCRREQCNKTITHVIIYFDLVYQSVTV